MKNVFEQWREDRDRVVEDLDVKRFRAFYRLYQGVVYDDLVDVDDLTDEAVMLTMCSMAQNIPNISPETKQRATEWMTARSGKGRE